MRSRGQAHPHRGVESRAAVSIVRGDSRRKTVHDALAAIDDQIRPALRRKKYVLLKPNTVNVTRPLGCTDADAVRGVLDYLAPRFKGPVVVAESSGNSQTWDAYENFGYTKLVAEHRSQRVSLLDLNQEARFELVEVLDANLHLVPIRLAARLMDPDAYVIGIPRAKTHVLTMITLAIKNMTLGAPLHQAPGKTPHWNDKGRVHPNRRLANYNMMLVGQRLRPHWGATVIDAFQTMEGNGPLMGTMVDHGIAVASIDYLAADRVMAEAMGVKAETVGHLVYCAQAGLGQYDLAKIDIRGESLHSVRREYRMPSDHEATLEWMQSLSEQIR